MRAGAPGAGRAARPSALRKTLSGTGSATVQGASGSWRTSWNTRLAERGGAATALASSHSCRLPRTVLAAEPGGQ